MNEINKSIKDPLIANARHCLRGELLDSSLIVTTNKKVYNVKIINCNNYVQVYFFDNSKTKSQNLELLDKKIKKIDTDNLRKNNDQKNIEIKNIIRSKLECQRLAKCNSDEWKTFITLTIAENLCEIKEANKKFRNFIDKVKRVFKEFKYIGIPEFQKRGAVHYHLLTNIDINNKRLIFEQEDNKKFKHIKYWNEGFNKVDNLNNDIKKIIGYISKYMTKDIDNRLFNCHRYFYSRNLNKPTTLYLDLTKEKDIEYFNQIINKKEVIYENNYLNNYNNENIIFQEYI